MRLSMTFSPCMTHPPRAAQLCRCTPRSAQGSSDAARRLAILDDSLGFPFALTPGCPLRCVTRASPSFFNDGLRPAALFGGALKGLVLVLAADMDMDVRMRGRLFGAPVIWARDSRGSS